VGILFAQALLAQGKDGVVQGLVRDSTEKPLAGATIKLFSKGDSVARKTIQTSSSGVFSFVGLSDGKYQILITAVGYRSQRIDSIEIGVERRSYTFDEIRLGLGRSAELEAVVIVADRSLIQSKDGNISFLAGDSPLAAGANASELMTQVPLVNKDPDGKLTVRGKEPKILIDDKPVELNMQQLQDLLESMPGSSIEKIEVMTNPPPQFAQESAVINIVTRKADNSPTERTSSHFKPISVLMKIASQATATQTDKTSMPIQPISSIPKPGM